ncbi:MAG: 5'/3'-nucleotidase SurE [Pseudomonadota bacterium]|jgi:5'-nucleotidase
MLRRQILFPSSLLAVIWAAAMPAAALDILITNDDGWTANARALYRTLEDEGHRVLLSVPCRNQSGQGAALAFLRPIGPLTEDCVGGIAAAGAPGVGAAADDPNVHYVDATPVAALLYGLDVLAGPRWGGAPDLVISGPNEGNNTGQVNPSSGTVNNAVYALNRGLPALAVSADGNTAGNEALAAAVAQLVLRVVGELERQTRFDRPLLPQGAGLNINVPRFEQPDEALALPFARAVVGTASTVTPRFAANLAEDPLASSQGIDAPLPGISFTPGDLATADPDSEAVLLSRGRIAVSVIEGNFGADPVARVRTLARIGGLFRPGQH